MTESSGFVKLTVVKKQPGTSFSVGIRSVDDFAKAGSEFEALDKIIRFEANSDE